MATKRRSWRKSKNGGRSQPPLELKNPGKPSTKRCRRESRRETAEIVVEAVAETRADEGEAVEALAEDEVVDVIETARERIADGEITGRLMSEDKPLQPLRRPNQRLLLPPLPWVFRLRLMPLF